LPEEEIVGGEHPREYCRVGGEDLLSVGNTALIGGAANRHANPTVVGGGGGFPFARSSSPRIRGRSDHRTHCRS
jgi:hypothetical protein